MDQRQRRLLDKPLGMGYPIPMIEVSNLVKQYDQRVAVDHISFHVEKGEVLGFLGPNGAGKSTTLRILAGAIPATSGKVLVAGFDVFEQPLRVKRRVGYLPELPALYDDLDANAFLRFMGRIKGLHGKKLRQDIDRVADCCGLGSVMTRRLGHLAKGLRRRVGLAQALLSDPQVLILDEPTLGLDPGQLVEFRQLIQKVSRHSTIVLSTHLLPQVVQICTRVLIIHLGRVVAHDTLEALTAGGRSLEKTFFELTHQKDLA